MLSSKFCVMITMRIIDATLTFRNVGDDVSLEEHTEIKFVASVANN